jgi:hypothetical protein
MSAGDVVQVPRTVNEKQNNFFIIKKRAQARRRFLRSKDCVIDKNGFVGSHGILVGRSMGCVKDGFDGLPFVMPFAGVCESEALVLQFLYKDYELRMGMRSALLEYIFRC